MHFIRLRWFLLTIVLIAIWVGSASAQDMMQNQPQIEPQAPSTAPMPPHPPSNREMQIPQQVPQEQWTLPPTPAPPPINIPMMAPQPDLLELGLVLTARTMAKDAFGEVLSACPSTHRGMNPSLQV